MRTRSPCSVLTIAAAIAITAFAFASFQCTVFVVLHDHDLSLLFAFPKISSFTATAFTIPSSFSSPFHQYTSVLLSPRPLQVAATTSANTRSTNIASGDDTAIDIIIDKATTTTKTTTSTTGSNSLSSNHNKVADNEGKKGLLMEVNFPPPLSALGRLQRAATFWSVAVPIVAQYYGLISRIKFQELIGTPLNASVIEQLWQQQHTVGATQLANVVTDLKGFYVKTAQIISSRQDLFPPQYTDALSGFTDNLDPIPVQLAKAVVQAELLVGNETFDDVFVEFDPQPLGAASVAQVHRARLSAQYGHKEVAVKIQRPSIESKLMGDIKNLKAIALALRDSPTLPLDYYTVFCELEKQLAAEFDFVAEAVAMDRIYQSLARDPFLNLPRDIPIVLPRPVPGLVSHRVLVMDYLHGVPLSRAREHMIQRGINPDSDEAKVFARHLLKTLTAVFGRNILETGFFHADPHPGNIFVLDNGQVGLVDFGQVKQISGRIRETLAKVMIAIDDNKNNNNNNNHPDLELVGKLALDMGVTLKATAKPEAAAAVGIWLFDGSVTELPGGYDLGELSPNSPVKELKAFGQDLVLVGRSTILIKGLASRLNISWSLAREWAPIARHVLAHGSSSIATTTGSSSSLSFLNAPRVRFREVYTTLIQWVKGRVRFRRFLHTVPAPVRSRLASIILKIQDWKARKQLTSRKR